MENKNVMGKKSRFMSDKFEKCKVTHFSTLLKNYYS